MTSLTSWCQNSPAIVLALCQYCRMWFWKVELMFLCGSGQVHVLHAPYALCSSLCYTLLAWTLVLFKVFFNVFCQISVQFLEAPKLVLINGVYKSVPAPCGGNKPEHQACSQLLSLVSLSFVHYSTFASSEGSFHFSFPPLLSFVHFVIFFTLFSLPPQLLSCLLASPSCLPCLMITPPAACP